MGSNLYMEMQWQDSYHNLLREYSLQKSEVILYEASNLSKVLAEHGVGPEDLVQLHLESVAKLLKEVSPLQGPGVMLTSFDLLLEVMMAYALRYREYLEVKNQFIKQLKTLNQNLATLNQDLETKIKELTVIQELTRELGPSLDLDHTVSVINCRLRELMNCQGGLFLTSDDGYWRCYDLDASVPKGSKEERVGIPAAVLEVKAGGTIKIESQSLTLPLVVGQVTAGAVYLQKERGFSRDDLRLAEIVTGYAALAIERAQLYEAMKHQATIDGKTGLYNYQHLLDLLNKEIARSKRYRRTFTMAMLDIDDFKIYNDTYGHLQGDQALQKIAALMRASVREVDVAARFGGEEFLIIMPETHILEAIVVAERIRQNIMKAQIANAGCGPGKVLTVSIGLSIYPGDAAQAQELIAAADRALYQAKRRGKNTIQVFSQENERRTDNKIIF